MKYVFLDTNFFIHFKDFDEINWLKLLKSNEIEIVIPQIIIHELDEKKRDRDSKRVRERSKKALKKIFDYSNIDENTPNLFKNLKIRLNVLSDSPKISKYKNLVAGNNDDEFIAAILDFKNRNPAIADSDIYLVTDDIGLLVKAKSRKMEFFRPPKELSLRDEPTIEEHKILKLEEELKTYKSKEPKLEITLFSEKFNDKKGFMEIELIDELKDEHVEETLAYERRKIELGDGYDDLIEIDEDNVDTKNQNKRPSLEIIQYQNDCDEYIKDYKIFLISQHFFRQINHRLVKTPFILNNTGNTPATDVIIFMTFPTELDIRPALPEIPEKPKLPEKPESRISRIISALDYRGNYLSFPHFNVPGIDSIIKNKREEVLKIFNKDTKGRTTIQISCGDVKHNLIQNLPEFYILFPDNPEVNKVKIHYKIIANNISKPVENDISLSIVYKKIYTNETDILTT